MGRWLNLEMPKKVPFYGKRNASCFQIGRQGHRILRVPIIHLHRRLHRLQHVRHLCRCLNRLQRVRHLRRRLNRLQRVRRLRRRVSLLRPLRLRAKSGSVYLPPTKVLIVIVHLHSYGSFTLTPKCKIDLIILFIFFCINRAERITETEKVAPPKSTKVSSQESL